jgi:hypothetical protein
MDPRVKPAGDKSEVAYSQLMPGTSTEAYASAPAHGSLDHLRDLGVRG